MSRAIAAQMRQFDQILAAGLLTPGARMLTCADGPLEGQPHVTTAAQGEVVQVPVWEWQTGPDVVGWTSGDSHPYRVEGGALVEHDA